MFVSVLKFKVVIALNFNDCNYIHCIQLLIPFHFHVNASHYVCDDNYIY